MSSTNIDYVDTYFEFRVLTKIHGEPTYETLKAMKNQLKSNACSVTSDLGGGAHGHLGLLLTPTEYAITSPTPYVRPVHPGVLTIVQGTAHHEATRLRAEHKESIRFFRETVDVEKALKKQVVAALDPKFLDSLRDPTSNSIMVPIHEVLAHLFRRYGRVDADTLADIDEKVRTTQYNVSEPLVTVYNDIEELARIAVAADNPYSDKQQVQLGLKIIKNTQDFEAGIREWYARPANDHTWVNFKLHFDNAHALLRQIRGTEMQNSPFQQVNIIAANIRTDIESSQRELLQAIAETNVANDSSYAVNAPAINAVLNNNTSQQTMILDLLRQLNENVQTMNVNGNSGPPQRHNDQNETPPRQNRNTLYCWSHGMCAHKSSECRNKKNGHKDNATKQSRMNGSNKGCAPAT